jgi:putative transposase
MYDGKHIVYSDGGGTWYSEACVSLNLEHRLHSSYEKSIVVGRRTIEYLKKYRKYRAEAFDDYYYPCISTGLCNLQHVNQWLILFVFMHNSVIKSNTKFINLRDEMS